MIVCGGGLGVLEQNIERLDFLLTPVFELLVRLD
jgi:hypothetical protein